ncbi:hypothetical protein LV83_03420 [Algoriphagus yeomjeoni]|uniref:Uncharacterized protein n=1 Tax=Algoriphagus yeomjeoni TaxID=291403 RepID=A0A327P7S2_9BACT|nr:hypothetical protein LV83_03420 [Algoriphagus yeomjeoni]
MLGLCLTCVKCKVVIFKIKINFLLATLNNLQRIRLILAFFKIKPKNQVLSELYSDFL